MRKPKVYDLYSYGKHIFTGTRQQISEQTGLAVSTLGNIVSHGHKQYRLEPIGKLEPVYALYERDVYVASGTVQELAGMVGMKAKHLNWRQFDSVKNMGIDYRYHIYKLEGEHEVVRENQKVKHRVNVYELKINYERYSGTAEDIAKQTGWSEAKVRNNGVVIGHRLAKLKGVNHETGEVFYGALQDMADWSGIKSNTVRAMVSEGRSTRNFDFTFTGQYIVDLIGVEKPKIQKPTAGHIDIKPVYTHKPVPISRYAKELLDWSTRHLRRDA